jgi:hypothetical protein
VAAEILLVVFVVAGEIGCVEPNDSLPDRMPANQPQPVSSMLADDVADELN